MKQTYHTDLIVRYQLGLLSTAQSANIPRSTRHTWKHRDLTQLIGLDDDLLAAENLQIMKELLARKRLMKAAKALWWVYSLFATLFENLQEKHLHFRQHKKQIIDTFQQIQPILGFERSLRIIGITKNQYYSWIGLIQCRKSPLNLCKKRHPQQLTEKENRTVKRYLTDPRFQYWSLASVYFQILRDKAAFMARSTFYKYAHLNDLARRIHSKRKRRYKTGIRANRPLQILHADITVLRTADHAKAYLYLIQDNFSRAILGWKVSTRVSAAIACDNLNEVMKQYRLEKDPFDFITDGGPENKGEVKVLVEQGPVSVQHFIAQKDIHFSNSMIEAANKRLKYDHLFPREITDFKTLEKVLPEVIEEYNRKPLQALHGLTPKEVISGRLPAIGLFSQEIFQAKKDRIERNTQQKCEEC